MTLLSTVRGMFSVQTQKKECSLYWSLVLFWLTLVLWFMQKPIARLRACMVCIGLFIAFLRTNFGLIILGDETN